MRKYIILMGFFLITAGISENSTARDLDISIKKSQYTEEGVKISYSVSNQKNFLRRNVIIAFKVILEDKPVGCETITLDIPADSKDDETMETTIPAPCKDKACKVQAQIFDSTVKKYRIENWMSDCP